MRITRNISRSRATSCRSPGDDPQVAWKEAAAHALAAASPGALRRTVHLSFGDFPGQEYLGQLTADHVDPCLGPRPGHQRRRTARPRTRRLRLRLHGPPGRAVGRGRCLRPSRRRPGRRRRPVEAPRPLRPHPVAHRGDGLGMDAAGSSTHLTFLFTDIEASSRAWEAQPAVMSLALARHDELLQTAVKSAGGSVFKHTGDGVCAAFPTAPAALAAALAAQQALHAEDWSETAPATGPHGAPQRGGGASATPTSSARRSTGRPDCWAPPMAARWSCRWSPPSSSVKSCPDGADLLDLGEHRLADLPAPSGSSNLPIPSFPPTFPALRSLTTRRHNLPVATSSFIGREQELRRGERPRPQLPARHAGRHRRRRQDPPRAPGGRRADRDPSGRGLPRRPRAAGGPGAGRRPSRPGDRHGGITGPA